jgi:hypothetical protein
VLLVDRGLGTVRPLPHIKLRVGALVMWRGQCVPIANRHVAMDCIRYVILTKDPRRGLVTDVNVTIGQLMAELCAHAQWCVGDQVAIEHATRQVQARWWNCRTGAVMYRVNDVYDERRIGGLVVDQQRLQQLVDKYAEVA